MIWFFTDFDEDELEAELNELEMEGDMEEQEKLEAELLDVGVADQLPETPREEPAAAVAKPAQGNLLWGSDNKFSLFQLKCIKDSVTLSLELSLGEFRDE